MLTRSFYNTDEMLQALHERYKEWEADGLPSCDARMRDVLPRLNLSQDIVTVFCCEGHLPHETEESEDYSSGSNIFMIMFSASKEGVGRLMEFYDALINRCDDTELRCMINLNFGQSENPLTAEEYTYPTVILECVYNYPSHKPMFFETLHKTLDEHTL